MPKKKCPRCHSTHIVPLGTDKKLSMGKAILGGAITSWSPIGVVGGALVGKKGKTEMLCQECGKTWKIKL